jgi:TonB-dependent receptor
MNGNRFALTAALLATSSLVPLGTAFAQETDTGAQSVQTDDVIVVRYQFVPDEKRVTSEVSSVLSAEDIALTGDSDIASALARVTGLSVQDGRFVIVRGLNERYSNTLINGSPLASPEPFRRAVPLDLFPTSLISNILVQKTFSPEYPGAFGGGLVQIETSALPNERFFEAGVSVSADTATNFDNGLMHDGGSYDYTGFSDETRDFPRPDIFQTENIGTQDPTTLAEIGRGLENAKLWLVQDGDLPGNGGFNFTAGDRYDFDNFSIGIIASAGYDNAWETREGVRATSRFQGNGLGPIQAFDRLATENEIETNALFSVGLETGDHQIQALALVLRSTVKETETQEGFDETGNDIREDRTGWFERQVYTYQLTGDHSFNLGMAEPLGLEWRVSTADASRNAPNQRRARYRIENADAIDPADREFILLGQRTGNTISFSRVDEVTDDFGFDLSQPVTVLGRDVELKAGYSSLSLERTAYSRQFFFDGSIPAGLNGSRIDFVYADQNILSTRFFLREVGGLAFPEAYRGELEVEAGYVGADAQVTDFLRAAVGVRFEDGEQTLETFAFPITPTALSPTGINPITPIAEDYTLPAATLTWTFADNLQLRVGYSETITRPQFRELGFSQFVDTETDELFVGNPYLVNSELTNYDARLEYYFGREQFVTAGIFYKDIENPIVEYLLPTGENQSTSFINAPEASLLGYELEYQHVFALGDMYAHEFWDDIELFIKGNYTFTQSEMSVSDTDQVILAAGAGGVPSPDPRSAAGFIVDGQRLQGQSEHILNLQVGWEDDVSSTALLFTYNSERTRALQNLAPGEEQPAIVEEPPIQLDLVHNRRFELDGRELSARFAVRNILGNEYTAFQERGGDRLIVDSYDRGTTFSLSLTTSF